MGIADKIKKIVAKANSTTHGEEAEVFMHKARALMMEHGLSLLDLGRLDADDAVGLDKDVFHNNRSGTWQKTLAYELSRYYGCSMVAATRGTLTYWTIAGRESARLTFTLMWPFVDRQIKALARREFNMQHYRSHKVAMTCIAHALTVRIYNMNKEQQEEEQATGMRGLNALVPVGQLQEALEQEFSGLIRQRRRSLHTSAHSRQVAGEVGLHRQTGGAPMSRRIS